MSYVPNCLASYVASKVEQRQTAVKKGNNSSQIKVKKYWALESQ